MQRSTASRICSRRSGARVGARPGGTSWLRALLSVAVAAWTTVSIDWQACQLKRSDGELKRHVPYHPLSAALPKQTPDKARLLRLEPTQKRGRRNFVRPVSGRSKESRANCCSGVTITRTCLWRETPGGAEPTGHCQRRRSRDNDERGAAHSAMNRTSGSSAAQIPDISARTRSTPSQR